MIKKDNKSRKERIKKQVRKKIFGLPDRPRLSVHRSLKHIYAQLIDDSKGLTLVYTSSLAKDIKEEIKKAKSKIEQAKLLGKDLAKKAIEKNIQTVIFDRGGHKYHGNIKALADGAREGGLKF